MKKSALLAALVAASALAVPTASVYAGGMAPFAVTCSKTVSSGGVINISCKGRGREAATSGAIKPGQRIYAHWAAKPKTFTCRAGFGVPGPFSTGTISC